MYDEPHPTRRPRRSLSLTVGTLLLGSSLALTAAPPAAAATSFTATANLDGRDGPSLDSNTLRVDEFPAGQQVPVVCQAQGELAYGSTIWDKTTTGHWVSDAYVRTGVSGFAHGVPRCDDVSKDAHLFPATAALNARNAPSTSATVVTVDAFLKGDQVPVVCQATGSAAYGSTVWDKTTDGTWVPDAYVRTGSTGFATGVPRCATTTAPTSFRYPAMTELDGRSTRRVAAPAVKVYPAGSIVTITCQAIGENAYGSTIWDKTSDGLWITDHYLKTGFDTFVPGVPRCADDTSGSNRSFPATADLDGRTIKKTSAAGVKTYPKGSNVTVRCQAYGTSAYGSYIWDKTADGLWVPDAYVRTGTTGFVSNMPRCDNDQPSGGTPTGTGGSPTSGGSICDRVGHGQPERNGPSGSTSGTSAQKIERVIAAARSQTGKNLTYSWGAGDRSGPTCGSEARTGGGFVDYNRYGFDCSGLMQYAFWAGAGVNVGGYSSAQSLKGTRVPYDQAKAGDMIFWGSPGNTTHVAVLIGGGKMIEAAPPRNGNSVHVTSVYGAHTFAIRMFP